MRAPRLDFAQCPTVFTMPTKRASPAGPSHAELTAVLRTLRLGVGASDLHGSLCGFLAGGSRVGPTTWLDALQLDADSEESRADPALDALFLAVSAEFARVPAIIEPLLPPADASISSRADALVEWCRGFLGGFGLSGAGVLASLPADANEILGDLGSIAASRLEVGNGREDARALAEILDFVRMGVGLLHREAVEQASLRSVH